MTSNFAYISFVINAFDCLLPFTHTRNMSVLLRYCAKEKVFNCFQLTSGKANVPFFFASSEKNSFHAGMGNDLIHLVNCILRGSAGKGGVRYLWTADRRRRRRLNRLLAKLWRTVSISSADMHNTVRVLLHENIFPHVT